MTIGTLIECVSEFTFVMMATNL